MQPEIHVIVKAVIAYLIANPHACDNEEGIDRWWLADHGQSSRDVSAALDWLVVNGFLQTVTAADGRTRYRRLATDDSLKATLEDFSVETNQRST
ncbi:MAG TPA: hypothetical protein VKG63_07455 [Steroidobacteraceae bacterium]|nr:hypothetical protein [Steroidobacteraceae bacterium]